MKKLSLIFLAFALSAAPGGSAQEKKGSSTKGTDLSLNETVTLDFDGAAFSDVVQTLEELSGCKFGINSRRPVGPITLNVQNVRLRTALDAICEGLGGVWGIDTRSMPATIHVDLPETGPRRNEIVSLDQPITLQLADADVRDVLRSCARLLGLRTEMTAGVCGTVTFDTRKTPLSKFLDEVCRQARCNWRIVRSTKESVLRVVPSPSS